MELKGQVRQAVDWMRRFVKWTWDARRFWLAIIAPILTFLLMCRLLPDWEPRLRMTGLALQVMGLLTVASGLRDTRTLFRRPSLLETALGWFRRYPRYRVSTIAATGSGVSTFSVSVRGRGRVSLPPGASMEDRVAALERENILHSTLIGDLGDRVEEEGRARSRELESERRERAAQDSRIQGLLEESSAGSLYVDWMGVFWLFIGLAFGTSSPEIARILPYL